jgi:hypothetical protein
MNNLRLKISITHLKETKSGITSGKLKGFERLLKKLSI